MKYKKMIIIIITLFILISLTGCKNINDFKEETIQYFNNYYNEIKEKNLEYSLVLIEYEHNEVKNKINNETNINKIKSLKKEYTKKIKNLIIDEDELYEIKKGAWKRFTYKNPNDIKILYFLGQYNNAYMVMIDKDIDLLDVHIDTIYGLNFNWSPYRYSVIYNNNYYNRNEITKVLPQNIIKKYHIYSEIIYDNYNRNYELRKKELLKLDEYIYQLNIEYNKINLEYELYTANLNLTNNIYKNYSQEIIDNFILSDENINNIKKNYIASKKYDINYNELKILYYLGKYDEAYVVILNDENDKIIYSDSSFNIYGYEFKFSQAINNKIYIIYKNTVFSICNSMDKKFIEDILTKEHVEKIYNHFEYIKK